ncbi:hypothetical protein [Amycolatopsis australiensis]|uniref:Uncharacterized protein n=1 Tax=Amycolatopsis australiensis TaxID=546364 RepID=A0A1K1LVG1_9PSEU|nr:hypothetical protein [Amycolatopsis australiensis]SFW13654.1 hypothetical protein SAMN04489730_0178 [Amycolatopsis australiensis]
MTPAHGWRPPEVRPDSKIYAGGLFRSELLHCVPYGATPMRLDSTNAAALGLINTYVVFARCGAACRPVVADLATDPREHCTDCWARSDPAAVEHHRDDVVQLEPADHEVRWPPESTPLVNRPAAAIRAAARLLPGNVLLGHLPPRRCLLPASTTDPACITAPANSRAA